MEYSTTPNLIASQNTFEIEKIRKDFPQLGNKIIYLDNAATTLKPRCVIDEMNQYYLFETANVHRGNHHLASQATNKFEKTRETIRSFINAKTKSEIIFTKGTTESINLLANSLGTSILGPGDVILLSQMEHHSNIVPWQLIAQKINCIIKVIPINDEGEIILDEYKKLLTEEVKIVSIVHISNTLGTINPIEEMIHLAHQNGSCFILDAAQSFLHETIDVQKLGVDFLAFSAHKALGPTGLGVLYGKEHLLEKMPPFMGGGEMIHQVSFEKTTFNNLPYKFEAGTPPIAEVIAFHQSLEYIKKIGINNIRHYEQELLTYATQTLLDIPQIKLIGRAKHKSAILSFLLGNIHSSDVGLMLDKQGLALRTGTHCTEPLMQRLNISGTVRASFTFYNTFKEVDSLKQALLKILDFY